MLLVISFTKKSAIEKKIKHSHCKNIHLELVMNLENMIIPTNWLKSKKRKETRTRCDFKEKNS